MSLLVTDAIVLHAFPYLDSSRIVRLVTRDAGVLSAIAKGARRPRSRFGAALDLFAGGSAQVLLKPSRELQTLAAFDPTRARPQLAADLERFTAASALAETVMRFAGEAASPELYEVFASGLDRLGETSAGEARTVGLSTMWRLVAEMGVAPSIDDCASCRAAVAIEAPARFSHAAGGILCERCAPGQRASRLLPPGARAALRGWLADEELPPLADADARAHQRLLREFLHQHLGDDKPLRALESWERGDLAGVEPGGPA